MNDYRLFIAVELPPDARRALAAIPPALDCGRAVRWTKPENIHLTLQFLGNTPAGRVEAIVAALKETVPPLSPFRLTLAGVGAFPNARRPRVVWVGVGGETGRLAELHRAVITATRTVGFRLENRPFKPHLTIARVQKWAGRSDYARIEAALRDSDIGEVAALPVESVALIRSQLRPQGARYTTLAVIPLAGTSQSPD